MMIVTDSGVDLNLDAAALAAYRIHVVPLIVTLGGRSYREGVDLHAAEFYPRLASAEQLPTTSQPSPGDFAEVYRRLAHDDSEILSIHMSSGLSGTYNAARAGAELVPEARVTHVDTKTLSAASGWQVEAAARAGKAGWPLDRILTLLRKLGQATDSIYTLNELKYLIHGGRISHMKGLIASVLNIKPLIGVEKDNGTYVQRGSARTFPGAVRGLVDLVARQHGEGASLRVQVLHADNPEGAELLRAQLDERFRCSRLPVRALSLVLGAHTGPSMVGVAYSPASAFADVPAD